jgi:putative intracellular protease/amidase
MKIAMLLYDNMTALDFVGPYQVFAGVPDASVLSVARTAGPIRDDQGNVLFNAQHSLQDVEAADILFVPGSSNNRHVIKDGETLEWLRKIDRTTRWTTSVCTGSLILGRRGSCATAARRRIGLRSSSSSNSAPNRSPNVSSSTASM